MTLENTDLSRRKLLRTTAIGVPAAGVVALGANLVMAPAANAIATDGYWGAETTKALQNMLNKLYPEANLVVDGVVNSQPSSFQPRCPGITGGWEWVADDKAEGSPTMEKLSGWLFLQSGLPTGPTKVLADTVLYSLFSRYNLSKGDDEYRLDAPSEAIRGLQNEINLTLREKPA